MRVFDIFEAMWQRNPNIMSRDELWWPNSRTFEVVVGAILTQQTKWENVEKSLNNLGQNSLLALEKLAVCDEYVLANIIKPAGFYNTKAVRIINLCNAIVDDFECFDNFVESVEREWLLSQKGIGKETADSILCYGCERDIMVVDSYTFKLFKHEFDIEDMEHDELRELIESGVESNYSKFCKVLADSHASLCKIYALFHGLIVEHAKNNFKRGQARIRLIES